MSNLNHGRHRKSAGLHGKNLYPWNSCFPWLNVQSTKMGVIYKTKEHIREYILQEKRANPHLSCRQLAPLIKKKFAVSLSKSTINSIFKEANLSAPVGRSPVKKIKISEKPLQIEEIIPSIPLPAPIEPIAKVPEKLPPPPTPFPEPIVIKEDIVKPPEPEPSEISEPIEIAEDELLDGMGCFFLKAAEWELSNDSIVGGLLKKYLTHPSPEAIALNSEILLFMGAFGFSDWKKFESYHQKGLWAVNQAKVRISRDTLLRFAKDVKKLRGLSMALFNEYDQYLPEIRYLKVRLEDDTIFYLDPQFRTLWQDSNIPESFSVTTYKASRYIKGCFLDNVQTAILQTAPGSNAFSRILSEFIWCFEAIPGKTIEKISLFNLKRTEVRRIVDLSPEKRYFILGFWPWQEEGMRFIREDLRIVKSFVLPEQNKEVFYSENITLVGQHIDRQRVMIRVGLIRDTALGWPRFGVLTNIPQENQTMEEIILAYLRHWPNQEEGYQDLVRKTSKVSLRWSLSPSIMWEVKPVEDQSLVEYSLSLASTDLHTSLNSLLFALNNYCQRHFFPRGYEKFDFITMQKRFYLIAGQIERNNKLLLVKLRPPPHYAYLADLIYAAQRINESDIETPAQERIIMKVEQPERY